MISSPTPAEAVLFRPKSTGRMEEPLADRPKRIVQAKCKKKRKRQTVERVNKTLRIQSTRVHVTLFLTVMANTY